MQCELRGRNGRRGVPLHFESETHLVMKRGACRRREPVVQGLPKQRMAEGVRHLRRDSRVNLAGCDQPDLFAQELIARVCNPEGVAFQVPAPEFRC